MGDGGMVLGVDATGSLEISGFGSAGSGNAGRFSRETFLVRNRGSSHGRSGSSLENLREPKGLGSCYVIPHALGRGVG
jgi:hypothetical protein